MPSSKSVFFEAILGPGPSQETGAVAQLTRIPYIIRRWLDLKVAPALSGRQKGGDCGLPVIHNYGPRYQHLTSAPKAETGPEPRNQIVHPDHAQGFVLLLHFRLQIFVSST